MSTERTPTTEEVREAFSDIFERPWSAEERIEEFDRWLAEHDAEVAAKALRDMAEWGDETQDHYYWGYNSTSETLRARADEIVAAHTTTKTSGI